ncbi:MAG: 50S ribosomal protein L25 [Senegalia sp. (in: firmicutes)]|uniref:50S ribosomal protein L25 n=1 Tax=Senegalia sp. (in: firmicutes) TaxID=1924098 RepID=UPI003F9BF00C
MATKKLTAKLREEVGTGDSNQLRREGYTPGVLYGRSKDTKNIAFNTKELQKIVTDEGYGALVTLDIDGKNTAAILKDVQREIVKDGFLHADFQELSENEEIRLTIPLYLENREKAETNDSIVQLQLSEIDIECLPKYIVSYVNIDAAKLKDQPAITIGDLELEGIDILHEDDEVIASLTYASKAQEEDDDDEEATETPIYEDEKSVLE